MKADVIVSRRNFRLLVIGNWVACILLAVISVVARKSLPPEVKNFIFNTAPFPTKLGALLVFLLSLLYLIWSLIVYIGLFKFKRWARKQLLPLIILGYLMFSITGRIVIRMAWVDALIALLNITTGIIIALAYYSPVSRFFDEEITD